MTLKLGPEQLVEQWYHFLRSGRLERRKKFSLGHIKYETTMDIQVDMKSCRSSVTDVVRQKSENKGHGHRVFVKKNN